MPSKNANPFSAAIAMHDTVRLRRLAAAARTNDARMLLMLVSDMLDRQVRLQLEKCVKRMRKMPVRARPSAA